MSIMEGTSPETGEGFFAALVKNLAKSLDMAAAWVTEYASDFQNLQTLAFWFDGRWVEGPEGGVKGTPCQVVINKGEVVFIAEEVAGEFPDDPDLVKLGLDEVAQLPPDLQAELLRVRQEGEFEPVGSAKTRKVDVRVIAATHRDLKSEVAAGRFREDLYFRLSVFPLRLPPLRERGEDVVLLAESFVEKTARRMGRRIEPVSATDRERLKTYAWPGNVRELQNVIERAVITAEDGPLNLDRALPETSAAGNTPDPPEGDSQHSRILTADQMQAMERENLLKAMISTGWRVSGETGAARLLGVPPSTLTSRLKALGLKWSKSETIQFNHEIMTTSRRS